MVRALGLYPSMWKWIVSKPGGERVRGVGLSIPYSISSCVNQDVGEEPLLPNRLYGLLSHCCGKIPRHERHLKENMVHFILLLLRTIESIIMESMWL